MTSRTLRWALVALAAVAGLAALVVALNVRGEDPIRERAPAAATPQLIERGAYLARAGNCIACHTARGGASYAGGRAVETPFGTVYASNLTPDRRTGLGDWNADHFWRAMHNGRSRDGRLLYPAFPYPNYTLVTRDDSDALFAYLRSLRAVERPNTPHDIRFPFDSQAALAMWRALFFAPERFEADKAKSAEWNRGAYLTRGLGHCIACHGGRNVFGATSDNLEMSGGLIPMQNWYAPSLAAAGEAGVAEWPVDQIAALMQHGVSPRGSVLGPMAEVVFRSTQYMTAADVRAIAVYLRELPQAPPPPPIDPSELARKQDPAAIARGEKLYARHCADCHGERGEGAAGAYPALAGNRAVTMRSAVNMIRIVQNGGYPPSTTGNPRPYGMPPFTHVMDDADVAAVVSYIRAAWGNQAESVSEFQVLQLGKGRGS